MSDGAFFYEGFQVHGPHGYRYTLYEANGHTTWSGEGYPTFDAAARAFTSGAVPWILDRIEKAQPPKWWQFWKPEIVPPSVALHVY